MDTIPTAPLVPYLLLINSLKDSIFVLDEHEHVVFMNQTAQTIVEWAGTRKANSRIHELLPELPSLNQLPDNFQLTQFQLEREGKSRFFEACQRPVSDVISGFQGRILYLEEITAQKYVERSLSAERNFITTILDTMEALMVVIDQRGRIVQINRACEQFFGYSNEEITNKRVWDLVQSRDELTINEMYANIQAGLSPFQSSHHWVTRDGTQKIIAWSSAMMRDEHEGSQYIVAFGIDMTDRERIEELLDRESLLLHSLIDSIPDLIFYKNDQSEYLGWNRAFQTFNEANDVAIKQRLTDKNSYPLELAHFFEETDRKVLETGQAVIYENWTKNAQGESILLETNKTPYYGPDGELLGVIGVGRDITRHRLLENELRAANHEISQLITSLSSGLIAMTTDLRITRWNPKAEKVLSMNAENVIGLTLDEIRLTWEWGEVAAAISRCQLEKRAIFMDPVRFKRQDGSEGYLGINISPLYTVDHTLSGFILLCGDITERKKSEGRLAQSQKLESIGQLAAGIAHEINTPIQYVGSNTLFLQQSFDNLLKVITIYQDALETTCAGAVGQSHINRVEVAVKDADLDFLITEIPSAIKQTLDGIHRVAEIVQAMKGFSHPGVFKKIAVNLNKALTDTLTVARNTWKYVAEVETDLDPELPDVICQPGEINQVFLNIIVNAADALAEQARTDPSRKGLIRVCTRQLDEWVEVCVADNGPGIPSEIRERIFEPFFTTKEVGKGTGQGLAIAYDIVEHRHGGTLAFETEIGQGTTFIIRLPLKASEGDGNGREDPIRG